MSAIEALLEVKDLSKQFRVRGGPFSMLRRAAVHAVEGVSFSLRHGETLGLVGESGCGKSTLARLILGLIRPSAGEVRFADQDMRMRSERDLKAARRNMQIVFQDPFSSLNPRMTVGQSIAEPLRAYGIGNSAERRARVGELLAMVGLKPMQGDLYPHEFSGGQRQRISIARALALRPTLLVCDEPVSALDVSIQAQVLNLLRDIQTKFSLTYLFISHDLAVIRHMSDRVAVMYLGKLVEMADADALFSAPAHPYTEALLSAVPVAPGTGKGRRQKILLEGSLPNPMNPPSGCRFRTRCRHAMDRCALEGPLLRPIAAGHDVACHLHDAVR